MDFRKEARHLQEFSAYLDASGMRAVATCPYVYKALSTQRCARLLTATVGCRLLWPCWHNLERDQRTARPWRCTSRCACQVVAMQAPR